MTMNERTEERPLSYSRWHRTIGMPNPRIRNAVMMVDIDGLECCWWCYAPLALIETARDQQGRDEKGFGAMRELARVAEIPAYVLLYQLDKDAEMRGDWANCIVSFRVRQVHPDDDGVYTTRSAADVAHMFISLHLVHHKVVCPMAEKIDAYIAESYGR